MPVRYEFEKELNEMHRNLVKMGALIEKQIDDMISALHNQDAELAEEVIAKDDAIDALERTLEKACIMIIARQQPIASDLRDIASILKLITDLERIADHCEDISQYTIKLSQKKYMKPLDDIELMVSKVKVMVTTVIDCCVRQDLELATKVIQMDDEIDVLFYKSVSDLQKIMLEDATLITQCTDYMFIVKYLERMGDHAENIAKWLTYNITGEYFK